MGCDEGGQRNGRTTRSHTFVPSLALCDIGKVARWQNLIPSFPWIAPGWRAWGRNPRKGRDQILQRSGAEPYSRSPKGQTDTILKSGYSHLATMPASLPQRASETTDCAAVRGVTTKKWGREREFRFSKVWRKFLPPWKLKELGRGWQSYAKVLPSFSKQAGKPILYKEREKIRMFDLESAFLNDTWQAFLCRMDYVLLCHLQGATIWPKYY